MNEEILREVALTTVQIRNDAISYNGNEFQVVSNGAFDVFAANEVITVSFSAGVYKDNTGTAIAGDSATNPLYLNKDYWFVYKITNDQQTSDQVNITGVLLTDTIPTNFTISSVSGDSGYTVSNTTTDTGNITITGQDISTPIGSDGAPGTITIEPDAILTVYVKVTYTIAPTP